MVVSNKNTSKNINSQIAISKTRTNEFMSPTEKIIRKTFRKKKFIKMINMAAQITENLEKTE